MTNFNLSLLLPPGSRKQQLHSLGRRSLAMSLAIAPLLAMMAPTAAIATSRPRREIAQTIQQPIEPSLSGQVWHLQQVAYGGDDETINIQEPYKYTLEFGFDGGLLLRADCNFGRGNYTRNESQLILDLGLLTRAACPPDSYSDRYVSDLSNVASYILEDGNLYLSLRTDGGILTFTPPQAVRAMPLSARSTPLAGPVWNLTEMIYPGYQIGLTEMGRYTLLFDPGGGVAVRADCNISVGSYSQTGDELTLALGPTTLAACPPNSLADEFLRALSGSAFYTLEEGRLSLQLQDQGSMLVFDVLEPIQIGNTPAEGDTLLADETAASAVTGTVSYRPRIALPAGAVIEIKLLDVSRADAPAITVAEQIIVTEGEQVPIPFSLFYDSSEINPRHTYGMRAQILINDELRWTTTSAYHVITRDQPSSVELMVEPVVNTTAP